MIRRFLRWLTGLFGTRPKRRALPKTATGMPKGVQAVKSANICLASRGATQRERNNAYTYLCDIESFYR